MEWVSTGNSYSSPSYSSRWTPSLEVRGGRCGKAGQLLASLTQDGRDPLQGAAGFLGNYRIPARRGQRPKLEDQRLNGITVRDSRLVWLQANKPPKQKPKQNKPPNKNNKPKTQANSRDKHLTWKCLWRWLMTVNLVRWAQ